MLNLKKERKTWTAWVCYWWVMLEIVLLWMVVDWVGISEIAGFVGLHIYVIMVTF